MSTQTQRQRRGGSPPEFSLAICGRLASNCRARPSAIQHDSASRFCIKGLHVRRWRTIRSPVCQSDPPGGGG